MGDEQVKVQPTEPLQVRYGLKSEESEVQPAASAETAGQKSDDTSQTTAADASSQPASAESPFSADQIARAAELGLDPDTFKSAASLERVLTLLETKQQPAEAKQQEPEPEIEPYKLELGEDVDESIVKAIRGMNEHYAAQLKQIKAKADSAVGKAEAVTGRTAEQLFESKIAALDAPWKEIFGEGPTRSLDHRTSAWKSRTKLAESIDDLHHSSTRRGKPLSDDELFQKALLMSFADKYEKIVRAKVAEQLKQTTHTTRPEQRNGHTAISDDPDARARAFAENFMRERQMA